MGRDFKGSAMRIKRNIKNAEGFSLVETLAVVAMSLALATLAVPSLIRSVEREQLNSASRNLAATLQAARFVAILRQGAYGVQINNSTHSFEVVQWNGSAWQSMTNSDGSYDVFSSQKIISPHMTISTTGLGTSNVVAFNSRGELLDASGSAPVPYTSGATVPTITVSSAVGSHDLTLTRFGNVKVMVHATTTQL